MANINQIEIKRGTAAGTIETQLYDIGSGSGVSAYGQIENNPYTEDGKNVANVRLSSEFDDFKFEQDALICIRIDDTVNTAGAANLYIKLFKSDGITQIEGKHFIARQFTADPSSYELPVNSLANNTAILLLCRGTGSGTKWYYLISDNFKPRLLGSILTIG